MKLSGFRLLKRNINFNSNSNDTVTTRAISQYRTILHQKGRKSLARVHFVLRALSKYNPNENVICNTNEREIPIGEANATQVETC